MRKIHELLIKLKEIFASVRTVWYSSGSKSKIVDIVTKIDVELSHLENGCGRGGKLGFTKKELLCCFSRPHGKVVTWGQLEKQTAGQIYDEIQACLENVL